MRHPNVTVPSNRFVAYAWLPTKMENGTWVWLEPYLYYYWSRMIPGCPTFKIKEAMK